ncbi:Hypothetical predicted protein [Pelobates cultripes]|uniref:Uncharacterized protein n=1 Tax=Pelobates cultripes TaxID=61616 RepID=A0AAD1R1G9_PELCU|nr:Hypothetical predicted protein [Pelobates cultripes]
MAPRHFRYDARENQETKKFTSRTTALQTNLMQCAAYGLSTDKLTPHPLNLCSNAGSTYMSISQREPLDMKLSMRTQLLRTTMVPITWVSPSESALSSTTYRSLTTGYLVLIPYHPGPQASPLIVPSALTQFTG